MSTTLDAIKELLNKIPDLKDRIREAEAPPVRVLQENAWIYNGFDTITLNYLGMPYLLELGKVTKISGIPDYWEVDQTKSEGASIARQIIPLKGEEIAREMIDGRGYDQKGLMVLLSENITPAQKKECDDKADGFIRKEIERFKSNRERARAGVVGMKVVPDPQVYNWMQKYSPDDQMFANGGANASSNNAIADAIALLTKLVAGQQTVTANPAAPEVQTVDAADKKPRRKPLETDEKFAARLAEWEASAKE